MKYNVKVELFKTQFQNEMQSNRFLTPDRDCTLEKSQTEIHMYPRRQAKKSEETWKAHKK